MSYEDGDAPLDAPEDSDDDLDLGEDTWILLSDALRFLSHFGKDLEPQAPQDALLSALRSGSVTSQCEVLQPTDDDPSLAVVSARRLRATDWAEAMHLNLWDNSINSPEGSPIQGIVINQYDLFKWITERKNIYSEDIISEYKYSKIHFEEICKTLPHSLNSGEDIPRTKNKGGRPIKYDWSGAYLKVLVRHLYVEGRLSARSSQAEVITMLRDAFATGDPDAGPQESVLKTHARRILAALKAADDDA
jgi:hypothetical protein